MKWIYDPQLKYEAPDIQKRMYDGRIFFAEYAQEEGTMYYNYTKSQKARPLEMKTAFRNQTKAGLPDHRARGA